MLLRITHRTAYHYPFPAWDSHNEARMMPMEYPDQHCVSFRLTVRPEVPIGQYETPWGTVHTFNIREPHTAIVIEAESVVETRRRDPFDELNLVEDDWSYYDSEKILQRFSEYLAPTQYVPLHDVAHGLAQRARRKAGPSVASFLIDLTEALHKEIEYDPEATEVTTTLDQVVKLRRGVCQDFAHWMLAACRQLAIPARYVSGYVYSPAGGPTTRAEQATHAWVECALPRIGWRGFDPTNNLLANDRYVKICVGRDYADAAPIRGLYKGPLSDSMEVNVRVEDIGLTAVPAT